MAPTRARIKPTLCSSFPEDVVRAPVQLTSQMDNIEVESEGLLLEHEEPGVVNVRRQLAIEDGQKRLMIHGHCQLVTPDDKVSGFVEGICHGP